MSPQATTSSHTSASSMTIHFGDGGWQIGQGGTAGSSFYVENILELLDSKMEWKRSDDRLYFMPKTTLAASLADGLVGGGVLETLIRVSGATNVTVRCAVSHAHTSQHYLVHNQHKFQLQMRAVWSSAKGH